MATSTAAMRRATPRRSIWHAPRQIASCTVSCITFETSKHNVQVAPHGHHAVIVSRARRGARDLRRIELLPLHRGRREPKELIRINCTVQHAQTPVSLKSHDETILCRAPGAPSASRYVYAHRRPRCDSRCQERGHVPSRVTRLWCGTAWTPLEHSMYEQAPQHCAKSNSCALSGMHQDDGQHRSILYHLLP